nr:reverse transcriptase domain-containing protein [Tanacetum cinerariifolium]
MKQLIAELPMLTAPMEKEKLIVYLAAAKETVSALIMTEKEAKQIPIYFVSRALRGLELNYTPMEKLKWIIELGEYAIHYRPRVSVKGHILADFIVERPEKDSSDTLMEVEEKLPEPWILFTDGSSCTDGFRAGLILTNPEGVEFTCALRFRFDATNNEAAYEALIFGLRIAEQMGVKNLQANVDSRLLANQVNGTYVTKEVDMIRYLDKVRTLTNSFKAFLIRQIPRSENKKADALSKIASTCFAHLSKQVLVEELKEKSIRTLPVNVKKVRAVRRKSWRYAVVNGTLYKKSFLGPWLSLKEGIKARLDARSKNWMEELPHVLWVHRIMIKSSNGDTPFSQTYGTEAVIPIEIGMPTLRTAKVDMVQNNKALEINLDLLEERREEAAIRKAKSKAKMEKYYNLKSEIQVSNQETLCTATTMQTERKTRES